MMLKRFLLARDGLRGMHPEWSHMLVNGMALGYLYGHVYGQEPHATRVMEISERECERHARRLAIPIWDGAAYPPGEE